MDIFYPSLRRDRLPALIRISLLGAFLAGAYGAIHDQVSYTISEEYFTKLKFSQFWYADFGFPPRIFAAEVGFLASWWVGLIAGWLLARLGLAEMPKEIRQAAIIRTFAIVLFVTMLAGLIGIGIGIAKTSTGDLQPWQTWQVALELSDLRGFVIVAHLHDASYLGGLIGLIGGIIYVRRLRQRQVKDPVGHFGNGVAVGN